MAIKVSEFMFPKPSDQRCDRERLFSWRLVRPGPRRVQAIMRVELLLIYVSSPLRDTTDLYSDVALYLT